MAPWGGVAGKRVLITGATNGIGLAAAIWGDGAHSSC
jgi:trans-2-enoyl-CoA reductase